MWNSSEDHFKCYVDMISNRPVTQYGIREKAFARAIMVMGDILAQDQPIIDVITDRCAEYTKVSIESIIKEIYVDKYEMNTGRFITIMYVLKKYINKSRDNNNSAIDMLKDIIQGAVGKWIKDKYHSNINEFSKEIQDMRPDNNMFYIGVVFCFSIGILSYMKYIN